MCASSNGLDTSTPAVLRDLDESHRVVQKSAESTSTRSRWRGSKFSPDGAFHRSISTQAPHRRAAQGAHRRVDVHAGRREAGPGPEDEGREEEGAAAQGGRRGRARRRAAHGARGRQGREAGGQAHGARRRRRLRRRGARRGHGVLGRGARRRAERGRRSGRSRPNFEPLELGRVDVDAADVRTRRSRSSRARRAADARASTPSRARASPSGRRRGSRAGTRPRASSRGPCPRGTSSAAS